MLPGMCADGSDRSDSTDRAKRGSKRHLTCDREACRSPFVSGASRNDSQEVLALADATSPLHANGGDPDSGQTACSGIAATMRLPFGMAFELATWWRCWRMGRTGAWEGLGRWRWVVERTLAWLSQFRRLRVRSDKRADIYEAFLSLGCAPICWQSLRMTWRTA
jgi:transposase